MAAPGVSATFSDLPTEMKAAIFAYIRRTRCRKTVCLVSRNWRDIMRPILWNTLNLKAASKIPGELACFLSPGNGVLNHVRYVDIYKANGIAEFDPISDFGLAVKLIIGALPRNCLLGIRIGLKIDMFTLLSLLQSQQSLEIIEPRTIVSNDNSSLDFSLATHRSWVTPTLHNVRKLRVPIDDFDNDHNAHKNSAYLLKNTPNLRSLCLKGVYPIASLLDHTNEHDAFGGPYPDGAVVPTLQLDDLVLQWLDLSPSIASLLACINFSGLRELSIDQCRNIEAFLRALIAEVPQATTLRKLKIAVHRRPAPSESDIQAIEAVVSSASSLEWVRLDVGRGRALNVSCLAGHGKSLRYLTLMACSKSQQPPYYTSFELDKLLNQAPNLETLAIDLCPVSLGHALLLGAKFKLPAQDGDDSTLSEFTALMDCIAKHQRLEILRILTVPSIDYGIVPNPNFQQSIALPDDYVYISQVMMQRFATEVIRYLTKRGSNLRVLIISPDDMGRVERPICDENGHKWPRYFYRSGWTRSAGGEEHVAVPVHPTDI